MGTTRTNVHDHQYAEDTENMKYITTSKKGNHGTGSRDCEVWKNEKEITKLKHTQNITYPEVRRMVETTKYAKSDKRNIPTTKKQSCYICEISTTTKPEVVAQLVNEMRVLIQKTKTIIEAVTEKLSKDPNIRVATSQERQAKSLLR